MIKIFWIALLLTISVVPAFSQLHMTRSGQISFHSHTFLENIDAVNKKVYAVIDLAKKNLAFNLLMKEFVFPKKLMQEHFNENYVESDKFPKASFSGAYVEEVSLDKNGSYSVNIRGKMTIHGVTRELQMPATFTVNSGTLTGVTTFKLNPTDYNIDIPFIVRDKIEKENTVKVKVEWKTKS